MKSETTTISDRRRASDATASSITAKSVVTGAGTAAAVRSSSYPMRSACTRPTPGGTTRAATPSCSTAPTRLPPRPNSRARISASSPSTSCLPRPGRPTVIDADRSSTSQTVSSRSSVYWRTCGSSSRAVAFQSMCRASSSST